MPASTLFAGLVFTFFQPPPAPAPSPQGPVVIPNAPVAASFDTGVFPLGATLAVADPNGGIIIDCVVVKTVPQTSTRTVRVPQPDGTSQDRTELYTVMTTVIETFKRKLPADVKIFRHGREISAEERSRLKQPTPIFITAIGTPNAAPGQGFDKIFGDALIAFVPNKGPAPSPVPVPVPAPATMPAPAPSAPGVTTVGGASTIEREVVDQTNAARKEAGLPPLTIDDTLMKAARQHSENMAKQGKLDHVLDGKGPRERLVDLGLSPSATGENCAQGQTAAADAMASWMSSDGHRGNILNPQFTHIGVAKADGPNGPYWTQIFIRAAMP
jgi:uncharacterized protein YkwD